MNTTYELNNLRRDSDIFDGKFNKYSPVVEVFSALVNGEELSKFGHKADKAVSYIKELGERAENGDFNAVAELNTLRRFVIESPVMEEIKLLNIFGSYNNVAFDDTIEREIYKARACRFDFFNNRSFRIESLNQLFRQGSRIGFCRFCKPHGNIG